MPTVAQASSAQCTAGAVRGRMLTAGRGLGALLALAALAPALAQTADDFPKRRPGLWEIRTVGAQASGLPPTQFCVGDDTDTAEHHLDRGVGRRGSCQFGAFRRAGSAWLAESVCREGRTRVVSRAIASGDFDAEYRIDTLVQYDPPLGGVRREDKEAVVARLLGPCEPGQKPGDMVVPGMGTLNMVDGTFRAEPAPRPATRRSRASAQ